MSISSRRPSRPMLPRGGTNRPAGSRVHWVSPPAQRWQICQPVGSRGGTYRPAGSRVHWVSPPAQRWQICQPVGSRGGTYRPMLPRVGTYRPAESRVHWVWESPPGRRSSFVYRGFRARRLQRSFAQEKVQQGHKATSEIGPRPPGKRLPLPH